MAKHVWPANRVNAAIRAVYVAYKRGRQLFAVRSLVAASKTDAVEAQMRKYSARR